MSSGGYTIPSGNTEGTVRIRVPGKEVLFYSDRAHPAQWAPQIVAELRMLLLLYSPSDIIQRVRDVEAVDTTRPPSLQQMVAHIPYMPVPVQGGDNSAHLPLAEASLLLFRSPLFVLSVGGCPPYPQEEVYNYTLDFTTDTLSLNRCGRQRVEVAGLTQLPVDVVRQLIDAANAWQQGTSDGFGAVIEEKLELRRDVAGAEEWKLHGNSFFGRQLYAEAHSAYQMAHNLCPATPAAATLLSTIYCNQAAASLHLSQPQVDKLFCVLDAVLCCHQSIAVQPSVKALYRLACARELLGPLQPAILTLQAATALARRQAASGAENSMAALLSRQVADKLRQLVQRRTALMNSTTMTCGPCSEHSRRALDELFARLYPRE